MKNTKEIYESVAIEIVKLAPSDVITTSGGAFNGKDDSIANW